MKDLTDRPLNLLPSSALVRTGRVDHPDWNYRRLVGRVQRLRFRMALTLLGETRFERLLEVGFGSGVLMPELAGRCDELWGVDPHASTEQVAANLANHGVHATLTRGSAESLPYDTASVDGVVSISVLEFVPDLEEACREIRRVLVPGGVFVLVTPGASPLWDLAMRLSTGETPAIFTDRRQRLRPAIDENFRVTREIRIPRVGGAKLRMYTGYRLEPR